MNPLPVFVIQILWFLLAWSVIAILFIEPRLRGRDLHDALSVWIAPHLFRVLGLGLLVEQLSPGLSKEFAASTAVGDFITAVLALVSLIALRGRWSLAIPIVWVFNIFGSADLLIALPGAMSAEAASHMHAQWYVPALGVPLMIVAHVMVFRTLLSRRSRDSTSHKSNA